MDQRHEELLRRLALNDEAVVASALQTGLADAGISGLDAKTHALVRLGGLIALGSAPSTFEWSVAAALAAGASDEEIAGVLVALAAVVGAARVSSAASEVAIALGCELDLADSE